ncbi:class V chitinase Chi100 [Aspergillus novofumigatus IBT 16806]|uniref:chitinase n=1 Tax=Aspergillus novofumigatus (strain IBT 16806) TaxID=1392255 RepID=A0A2I1CGD4_ASPN1|nr:class V chitinase Chi100 [Aspergillus novofumigatus IBT 16806]PKX96685.1 class V chitinase Chi100 [Aspergillus novofumigatus IBT 16806]
MRLPSLATAIPLAVVWASSAALALSSNANDAANAFLASLSISTVSKTLPGGCSSAGIDTSAWFVYGSLDRLDRACKRPMLLDFALVNPIDDEKSHVAISACTADYAGLSDNNAPTSNSNSACALKGVAQTQTTSSLQLASSGASSSSRVADVAAALEQLGAFATLSDAGCNETIKYAYSRDVAVGVYAGSGLAGQGVISAVLQKLSAQIKDDGRVAESLSVELCSNPTARYSLSVLVNTKGDLGAVQRGLQVSKNGSCVSTETRMTASDWQTVTYLVPAATNITRSSNSTKLASTRATECRTIQVESGDSCASLAAECGITPAQFTQYNPSSSLCSSLTPGKHVCCSAGTLPDFTPKPGADGYCYSYLVKTGDSCASLAAAYDLTNEKIESFNKETWGWNGCEKLFADYNICLSTGYPPMPATIPNAVCGPQCPLNACCNIWGQCGTTGDFCTPSNSSTGAPGTAAPGQNGCISNCGMDIVTSSAPAETYSIAYFEAFNWKRSCLRMSVNSIDTSAYTHIHYSFITLNEDFSINIDEVADQLPLFKGMAGIKKIVSVGGWAFSTELATYQIFRNAVATQANRKTLVTNIIKFLDDYNLDGVDWDWEYPAEPDIPGIPAGTEADTTGFFLLLNELKQEIPSGKTVSVTAPASFWYLQYFPIEALSLVVDYVVYMTYDLHGQWDYINKYATPGCPSYDQGLGNCLRSHVNLTETINSLSMITKAGVPSNMIVVGVSSYGRSFKMSTPGCWTEQCTYTGPDSGRTRAIREIIRQNPTVQELWDANSYSNIVVFNDTEWVAYMDEDNKATRKALYPGLAFLGTADWAVDLQSENGGGSGSNDNSSSGGTIYVNPDIWNSAAPVVTAPPGALTTRTSTLSDGTTTTYPAYVYESWLTVITIPPLTTTAINVWGVSLPSSSSSSSTGGPVPIILTSSVQPPPFTIIVTPVLSGTTSIIGATETTTISLDPIIWGSSTYSPPVETRTLGGSTTVIGGTTLPPTPITVTPNPHPTTTPEPGSTDPGLNSKKPSWTPGKPPTPTAEPGCPGCGTSCLLFCNPDCPFCPPGAFGPPGGGGGDNNNNDDDDDDDDEDPDNEGAQYTIVYDSMDDDPFPTAFVGAADLSSLDAEVMSRVSSAWGLSTTTTTTTTTKSTTTTTEEPTPTPTADCMFWDSILYWTFEIYNIDGWVSDGGDSLNNEEGGCGAMTGWEFHEETSEHYAYVYFNLPFFMKEGCVERAIVSAGGPKISCKGGGVGPTKRDVNVDVDFDIEAEEEEEDDDDEDVWTILDARGTGKTLDTPAFPSWTDEQLQEFQSFYEAINMQSGTAEKTYVPMTWGATSTSPMTTSA